MSHETLQLLTGSDQQFAQALVDLGWFRYPPTMTDHPFRGRARPSLSPRLRRAGQVPDTGAWIYRLTLDSHRWQDAVAIVESQLRAEPQFAVVFVNLPRTLLILAPEDPDKALGSTPGIRMAQLFLDTARPGNFENEMLKRLRTAKAQGFRARLQEVVNVERVTKKFYDEFKDHKDTFVGFIEGIENLENRQWYASVVLNRLMFIYFIQSNGLLDGNPFYLRKKLNDHTARGNGYYQDFLCPLFFEGFAVPAEQRSQETRHLLGDIPYLNGGLFMPHKLEHDHAAIKIKDDAFGRLYEFFDRYTWHIDDRPLTSERQINPDVLGFIFEKYVISKSEQKEKGAYYTKEDITGYICRNTVIPRIFDMLSEANGHAANSTRPIPVSEIEPYIYPAVKHGTELPLPPQIELGVADVSRRAFWNERAPLGYALPTETWREFIARRQRYAAILADFHDAKITTVNDFITYNLDLPRIARDFVDTCQDAAVLRDFYFRCLQRITILDPTCGSGAFLFAALNILYPLYEACLDRMEVLAINEPQGQSVPLTMKGEFAFVNEVDAQQSFLDPATLTDDVLQSFRAEIARIAEHPNRSYYIHKTIIVNNLYGVDIMEEAVEICKLRLFLNLIAHADRDPSKPNQGIEPLPDIDFNILAGNTLVGYTSIEDIDRQWHVVEVEKSTFAFEKDHSKLRMQVAEYGHKVDLFRKQQLGEALDRPTQTKEDILRSCALVQPDLDEDLWRLYRTAGKYPDPPKKRQEDFLATHQPFHWFLQFPHVMADGGFDAIIGNPPFVDYNKVKGEYLVFGFDTEDCGDLYAFVAERAIALLRSRGRLGLITPLAAISVSTTETLRNYLLKHLCSCWYSGFGFRPSKLFEGVNLRLTIILGTNEAQPKPELFSSRYLLWSHEERTSLFTKIAYVQADMVDHKAFVKIDSHYASAVTRKLARTAQTVEKYLVKRGGTILHYHRSPLYWIRAMDFEPYFKSETKERSVHHFRDIYGTSAEISKMIGAILNSSLFYFRFVSMGNCRNLTGDDVSGFPIGNPDEMTIATCSNLFDQLMEDYRRKSQITVRYNCEYQTFYPSQSKTIIDEIDRLLARYYGFTDDETDFIINYDIKYRVGSDGDEEV